MRPFQIRVYGDSLSLPRVTDGVDYPRTYPELMKKAAGDALPDRRVVLYNRAFSNATSEKILETYRSDSFYFGTEGNDVAVLQCGVVDCAPRPIPQRVRNFISWLPEGMRKPIIRFLHAHRSTMLNAGLMWRAVKPEPFASAMRELIAMLASDFRLVYVINIAPTIGRIEAHSPGFAESIETYNRLIGRVVQDSGLGHVYLIDVNKAIAGVPDGLEQVISAKDGHHINEQGHRLYADAMLHRSDWERVLDPEAD